MTNKIIERIEFDADDKYKYGSVKIIAMLEDSVIDGIFHKIEYKLEYLSSDRSDNYSKMLYSKKLKF